MDTEDLPYPSFIEVFPKAHLAMLYAVEPGNAGDKLHIAMLEELEPTINRLWAGDTAKWQDIDHLYRQDDCLYHSRPSRFYPRDGITIRSPRLLL
jgi:hypothetical protein